MMPSAAAATTTSPVASLVVELGEPFFHACVISLRGLTSVPRSTTRELAKAIEHHGGVVMMDDDERARGLGVNGGGAVMEARRATHAALEDASAKLREDETGACVVSAEWIRACLSAKMCVDVASNVLYAPPRSVAGLETFKDCVVCATGYGGQRRKDVETMVKVLGGTYQKVFDRGVTHLVAYEFSGAKWERAQGWTTAKIVNHRWLEECVTRWARVDEAPFERRSGKEEYELTTAVPDSEDEDAMGDAAKKEVSVVPDSMGTTTTRANAASADANAFTSQLETAPLTTSAKKKSQTPSAAKRLTQGDRSASKSARKSAAWRSPDWVEEEKRGARIAVSKRNRIDPKYKEALQGNCTQPEDMFHGLVGSPDDVEKAFGGRYAPDNAWFSFFEDAEAEPLTDAPNVDEFYTLLASGRRRVENEDNETRMARIRNGEIRFDVFDQGISERHEEEVLREGNGLCMRTLYSGTVILLDESLRNDCEGIIKFVDDLEMQQKQGPLGAWINAMIRVETAKQPVVRERVRPGADALMTTFLTYMHLAHSFRGTDYAQLFNGDGSFVSSDKIITLPARKPGNLAGVILAPVDRTVRDVVAGYYELLAGPSEPDPTQRPASQLVASDLEKDEPNEDEPFVVPAEDFMPEPQERAATPEAPMRRENQAPEPEQARDASKASTSKVAMTKKSKLTSAAATDSKPSSKPTAKPTVKTKATVTSSSASKAYVALSGFSSVDIRKYSALVRRLGAVLCSGHEWEPSTTHVIFGARGSRSIKFLAGAISGAHLLDESFLVECAGAGKIVDVREQHLWRGGRGAEMGVIDAQATEHWSTVAPHSAFEGLSIALLPFEPNAKIERAMLDVVLRAGGASLSSVSCKGDVCLTQAEVPDIVITDHADVLAPTAVPRLAPLIEAGAGGVLVVTPEFFKSWISTPSAALDAHCLFGASTSKSANDAVIDALSRRGERAVTAPAPVAPALVPRVDKTKTKTPKAQPTKSKARQTPARAEKPAERAVLLSQRQTRAKRAENAPLAERVGKRRRALKDSN